MPSRLLLLLILLCVPALLFGAEPIRVFVTLLPEQTFVAKIAGDRARVEALVGTGYSPHAYEPTPGQMVRLAEADLYFGIGLPLEAAWMKRIRAVNPKIRFVDLSAGIKRRQLEAHEGPAAHAHQSEAPTEQDPHIWTSPPLVIRMAERISAELSTLDPAHAFEYRERLGGFTAELERLDRDVRAELQGLKHRRFMVYHPAWGYFADTYELTQIPIEAEGKEPGPRRLAALIDQARHDGARLILVQPQMSIKAALQIAREIGGRVEVIDILSPDYAATMRRLAGALAEADR